MANYLANARRNRMSSIPISVGDVYIMPLNAKVYSSTPSPLPSNGALSPIASVLAYEPQSNAVKPTQIINISIPSMSAMASSLYVLKPNSVTIDIGVPAVFHYVAHGLIEGQLIQLRTTGNLPSGLVVDTPYYVTQAAADTFKLIFDTALVGVSGTQSGTHSLLFNSI